MFRLGFRWDRPGYWLDYYDPSTGAWESLLPFTPYFANASGPGFKMRVVDQAFRVFIDGAEVASISDGRYSSRLRRFRRGPVLRQFLHRIHRQVRQPPRVRSEDVGVALRRDERGLYARDPRRRAAQPILRLAPDTVPVPIQPVRIPPHDREPLVRDLPTVEVGRPGRNADTGVRRVTRRRLVGNDRCPRRCRGRSRRRPWRGQPWRPPSATAPPVSAGSPTPSTPPVAPPSPSRSAPTGHPTRHSRRSPARTQQRSPGTAAGATSAPSPPRPRKGREAATLGFRAATLRRNGSHRKTLGIATVPPLIACTRRPVLRSRA